MKFFIYPAAAIVAFAMAGSALAATCAERYDALGANRPRDWNAFQAQCELSSTGGGNSGAASGMAIPRPIQRQSAMAPSFDGAAVDAHKASAVGSYHETFDRAASRAASGVAGDHGATSSGS